MCAVYFSFLKLAGKINELHVHYVLVRPLWVRLQGMNHPLSAGTTYEIVCEVVGAKPEPTIEWTKGGIALRNVRQTVS